MNKIEEQENVFKKLSSTIDTEATCADYVLGFTYSFPSRPEPALNFTMLCIARHLWDTLNNFHFFRRGRVPSSLCPSF